MSSLHVPQHHSDDASPSYAEQLASLAQALPEHITHTLLPQVTRELESSVAELNAQVDDTRHSLLHTAVLRRSTVLAPILKQRLVQQATQLQRRRAQLVQSLRQMVKEWQAPRQAPSSRDFGAVLRVLEAAMEAEEGLTDLVQAPLRPSNAALTAFLGEAVARQRLHLRTAAQLAAGGGDVAGRAAGKSAGKPSNTSSSSTAAAGGGASSPLPDGVASAAAAAPVEDAIEASLHLLLTHIHRAGRKPDAAVRSRRSAATGPASKAAGANDAGQRSAAVCDVDVVSDEADAEALVGRALEEEDMDEEEKGVYVYSTSTTEGSPSSPVSPAAPASPPPPSSPTQSSATAHGDGPWLRIPGILSLRQYCADYPWVADMAEQRYAEAQERKKNSGSGGKGGGGGGGGGGGDGGYYSRHVQPDSASGATAAGRTDAEASSATLALSTMAPFGYHFSPSLIVPGKEKLDGSGALPMDSRRDRLAASAGSTVRATPTSAAVDGRTQLPGETPLLSERAAVAHCVARCVVPAVDAAWADVEDEVLRPFCTSEGRPAAAAASATGSMGKEEEESDDEEEAVGAFLDVVRVRYAVELAAQVVAARQAVELLLDSEDSVVFDGARLTCLSLDTSTTRAAAKLSGSLADTARAVHALQASTITCTVLGLPSMESIFYVVAYAAGAALLRESAAVAAGARNSFAATSRMSPSRLPSQQQQEEVRQLIIDVDAQDETASQSRSQDGEKGAVAMADEEDVAAQQKAALEAWAAELERRYLSRPNHSEPPQTVAASPAATAPHAAPASHFLASSFRLWLYLWGFVLIVSSPNSLTQGTRGSSANGRSQLLALSPRTACRWVEKVLQASVFDGVEVSRAVRQAVAELPSPEMGLPMALSEAEAQRLMMRTLSEARAALLRAADVEP